MACVIPISDLNDDRLDVFVRLTEGQLRSRRDATLGRFIAESVNVIALALEAGCVPQALLMEERHVTGKGADIIAKCGDIPVYTGTAETLTQLTGFALTRGILCAMSRPKPKSLAEVCGGARRLAVLDGIVDTTNLGAIFRSAAALHMDGVLLTPACCDPLNRRATRVSMGTVFQVPWAYLEDENYPETLGAQGIETVAMALTHKSVPIDDPGLMATERLAIVLGTEGAGLPPERVARCTHTAMIPMSNGVDSLNVAAASAVAFWQLR